MASLHTAARRFQTLIYKENGQPFNGTIMPVDEGKVPTYDFSSPRLMLRTITAGVVKPRDIILDEQNRRFIVANNGYSPYGEQFTFRLFQVLADLVWKRHASQTDTLTGLKRGQAAEDLGLIACTVEMTGREYPEPATNLSEETRRIVTGAHIQLGDQVDDAIVRRLDTALGVTYAEIR
ncbi:MULTISPECIES: hypothetical protein [unclassified Mesorhizobium]|uniref:hypothetical protein n=1 Tax=unclassified Mesorhizobium TaxID=325217 RepID=UPI00112B643E|nr:MULTISPECIES: hypothetical protein [unclassified Mesorhizobium]TPJ51674.1 hypothetical protein FJ426_20800 [Mesorhizobium sp. B2-6-4]TPN42352.1 hypothetical protein FJ979_02080 [Mesorhizobium sp. B1-1-6]